MAPPPPPPLVLLWWALVTWLAFESASCAAMPTTFAAFHVQPPWPSLSSPCVQVQLLDPECQLVVLSFCDATPGLSYVQEIHNASERFVGGAFPTFNVCVPLCPGTGGPTNQVQVMCSNQWSQNQVVAWRPPSSPACPLSVTYQYQEAPSCLEVVVRFEISFNTWILDPSLRPSYATNGTLLVAKYSRGFNDSLLFVFMPASEVLTGCGPLAVQIGFSPVALQRCFQPSPSFAASFPSDDRAALLVCWALVYTLALWGTWYGWWRTHTNLDAAVKAATWYTSIVAWMHGGLSVLVWGQVLGLVGVGLVLLVTFGACFLRRGTGYARFPKESFNRRNTMSFIITVTLQLGLLVTLPVADSMV